MVKTQKQIQGEQTRQHIIKKAAKLFARKGFYGTSISDLAQATGLTKGAFYHHFENKEALFFAVIDMVRSTWHEAVVRDVLKAKDALPRLGILVDNHVRLTTENEILCLVLSTLVEEMDGVNPTYMSALQDIYSDLARLITRIIQKGQKAKQIRSDLDAQLIAVNIVAMLRSGGCSKALGQLGIDRAARMATLKQLLLDSLQP
jgi:TetR/AcrR family transcriptional repressor of nem operon